MSASSNARPGESPSGDTGFEAMWSSDGMTRTFSSATAGLPADLPFLFQDGQRFGPYLIVRPLGKGGMGQVYEADEIESGRRVAIKILSRGLGDDEERERFLSEGRVAASLSHPNSVYIFGTCEVQGLPVIAMELAPHGTLKDLLVDGRPLAPAAAVDAILQVIAGLEGAAALGILHRDIKPSNCFVDRDGRILVGDFGLSIATLAREAGTPAGMIVGTPGFASPEQLRGEPLDVRSDIYSVGATIYYLLTGRPPFADEHVTVLVTRMATELPASPAVIRRDLPKGLAAIVMQCLARTPGERFANYRALAAALEPFRSTTVVPAGLPRRFLAGAVDSFVSSLPMTAVNGYFGTEAVASGGSASLAVLSLPTLAGLFAYYGIFEGLFGAAAGKAMLGLRVVGQQGTAPGVLRALLRAAIFILPAHVLSQGFNYAFVRSGEGAPPATTSTTLIWVAAGLALSMACLATLFSTARRSNGRAGLHDLGSRTRVVLRRRVFESRQAAEAVGIDRDASPDGDSRIGPYLVHEPIDAEPIAVPRIVEGYDDRLRRNVWIEVKSPDTPALAPLRRDLGRPARTRWLAGRRTTHECWDAFEAIPGQPLTRAIEQAQPWTRVRHWLSDLTHEIISGLADGSLPALDIDRVWVGADGRVRLLDWPAPRLSSAQAPGGGAQTGATERDSSPDLADAERFLYRVAVSALRGAPVTTGDAEATLSSPPLPLSARQLLLSLRDGRVESVEALRSAADGSLRSPAIVSRSTRAYQLAFCAAIPVFLPLIAISAVTMGQRLPQTDPTMFALKSCLDRLVKLDRMVRPGAATGGLSPAQMASEREGIEIYLATRLRGMVTNPATWMRRFPSFNSDRRELAARALAAHPSPSAEQLQKADETVARVLREDQEQLAKLTSAGFRWRIIVISMSIACIAVAVLGLIGAVAARGGLTFRMFGTAVVTRDGAPASRLRALLRALVAWAPAVALFAVPLVLSGFSDSTLRGMSLRVAAIALLFAGGLWAIRRPPRGIQDRVAGTWLVPR